MCISLLLLFIHQSDICIRLPYNLFQIHDCCCPLRVQGAGLYLLDLLLNYNQWLLVCTLYFSVWELYLALSSFFFMSLSQMQFFLMLNQTDCSSLNIVQSLCSVNIWTAHLNVEWWGSWIQQIRPSYWKHQQDPLLLNQRVESTGVEMKRGNEATVSTSQSLVFIYKTTIVKDFRLLCHSTHLNFIKSSVLYNTTLWLSLGKNIQINSYLQTVTTVVLLVWVRWWCDPGESCCPCDGGR